MEMVLPPTCFRHKFSTMISGTAKINCKSAFKKNNNLNADTKVKNKLYVAIFKNHTLSKE